MKDTLEAAMCAIGYQFKDNELLETALTHSSFANERGRDTKYNERLEFLGDAVLSVIVSDYLFHRFHLPEGELTKLRASLVCEKTLALFANRMGLGQFLHLGKGEEMNGGRERASVCSDAFEAVIAAIYLDGGVKAAREFVLPFVTATLKKDAAPFHDYKTILQEIIQKNPEERLRYVPLEERGPDHDKQFVVQVHLNSNVIGTGEGKSKKAAEQQAAKKALELMGEQF